MNLIEKAKTIAEDAHRGQTRWNGDPYITHPQRVYEAAVMANYDNECQIIAWLHDTVEDAENPDIVMKEIEDNFSSEVVTSIKTLTKDKNQSYIDYILNFRGDIRAICVKMLDLQDNMRDIKKGSMRDKYELSYYILEGWMRIILDFDVKYKD